MGRLVWAKMRTRPYWPAKIVSAPAMMGNTPENYNCVLFLGTKNFGFVQINNIIDYAEHRDKYANANKTKSFKHAVMEMDNYILDPVKYRHNTFVVPKDIKIKKEPMEGRVIVKDKPRPVEEEQATAIKHLPMAEKKKLIDKIMELRSENERFVASLKQAELKCKELSAENGSLTAKVCAITAENDDLRSKLSACVSKQASDKEDFAVLRYKKRSLEAVNIQMRATLAASEHNDGNESINDEYEVEKFVEHQNTKSGMIFRVRWKGYGESDDTWERESNLHCPRVLKKYLNENRSK